MCLLQVTMKFFSESTRSFNFLTSGKKDDFCRGDQEPYDGKAKVLWVGIHHAQCKKHNSKGRKRHRIL